MMEDKTASNKSSRQQRLLVLVLTLCLLCALTPTTQGTLPPQRLFTRFPLARPLAHRVWWACDTACSLRKCASSVYLLADENCQSNVPDMALSVSTTNCSSITVTQVRACLHHRTRGSHVAR
jgi:hypothetical protein